VTQTVLIANRGEIACRLVQACHELGLEAAAVYVPQDRLARHVQLADRAFEVGSYLDVGEIVEAGRRAHAVLIHPGYGFLAENAGLADACREAGVLFAGPSSEAMRLMADKVRAKDLAASLGVPLVPGTTAEDASAVGFPLLIKAAAGGGGKGMRTVLDEAELAEALASAKREAEAAFGDGRVFLERLVAHGRHVEVQIFGDNQGHIVHMSERDCSVQRRFQKILEESPAPGLSAAMRRDLHQAAVRLAAAAKYAGPGTVEFLVDGERFYFLEMNTRLQVEHPVTELVTGLDLAKLQIKVALGQDVPVQQAIDAARRGHAIEARVYAEDPASGFLPAMGRILRLELPQGPGIRNDTGIQLGDEIGVSFDPLLAKLIVWGQDRGEALARLRDALDRYCVLGLTTNLELLRRLAWHADFEAAAVHTNFIPDHPELTRPLTTEELSDLGEAAEAWRAMRSSPDPFRHGWRRPEDAHLAPDGGLMFHGRRYYLAEANGSTEVWNRGRRTVIRRQAEPSLDTVDAAGSHDGAEALSAPMNGMVVKVLVREGDRVEAHQTLMIIEAMKMEHRIQAPIAGQVTHVYFQPGTLAPAGATLIEVSV